MNPIQIILTGDAKGAVGAMNETSRALQGLATESRNSENMLGGIGQVGTAALLGVAAAAVAAGAAIAGAMKVGLDATLNLADSVDKLGDLFGMSGEQASAMSFAMSRVGLSVDEGGQGLNYFARMLSDANDQMAKGKVSPFAEAAKKLGVNLLDANGKLRTTDDLLPDIMDRFAKLPAGVNSTAIAMDMFGARGGSKFLDFLRQGSAGLKDADAKAKAFGLSMSTETSDRIEQFGFRMNELNLQFEGFKNQIGMSVLPYAEQFASFLQANVLPALLDFAKTALPQIIAGVQALGTALGGVIASVKPIIDNLFTSLQQGGGGGIFAFLGDMGVPPEILAAVQGLMDNLGKFAEWVTTALAPALSAAFQQISDAAMPTLMQMGGWITGTLLPALQQMGDFLGPIFQAAAAATGDFIVKTLIPALANLASFTFSVILPALGQLAGMVGGAVVAGFQNFGKFVSAVWQGLQSLPGVANLAKQMLQQLGDALQGSIAGAFTWFKENVLQPIIDAFNNLRGIIDGVMRALGGLSNNGLSFNFNLAGGRASGGHVFGGTSYLVGERGPELFTPGSSGYITPNNKLGGGVTLVYAPTISLADEYEARTKLMPFIRAALRGA